MEGITKVVCDHKYLVLMVGTRYHTGAGMPERIFRYKCLRCGELLAPGATQYVRLHEVYTKYFKGYAIEPIWLSKREIGALRPHGAYEFPETDNLPGPKPYRVIE